MVEQSLETAGGRIGQTPNVASQRKRAGTHCVSKPQSRSNTFHSLRVVEELMQSQNCSSQCQQDERIIVRFSQRFHERWLSKRRTAKWRSRLKIVVACFAGRSWVPWAESAGDVADYGSRVMEEDSHFQCAGAGGLCEGVWRGLVSSRVGLP